MASRSDATRTIFCCQCATDVPARLTDGRAVYPRRSDLANLPFWRCPACRNHVGCHHKTRDRTRPLGVIPSAAIREARKHIHDLLDPLWKGGRFARGALYAELSAQIGREYHTAEIRTLDEARQIYRAVRDIAKREAVHA